MKLSFKETYSLNLLSHALEGSLKLKKKKFKKNFIGTLELKCIRLKENSNLFFSNI